MKKITILVALAFIQIAMFAGSVITDSTFIHNMIVDGIDNATYIFEGEVISQQSYFNEEENYIYTSSTVKVFQKWKGFSEEEPMEDFVEVITRGGTVGNTSLSISHNTEFYVGGKRNVFDRSSTFLCSRSSVRCSS